MLHCFQILENVVSSGTTSGGSVEGNPAIPKDNNDITFDKVLETLWNWTKTTGVKILIAIVVLIVSFFIIKVVTNRIKKRMQKNKKVDKTISKTLLRCGNILAKILVIVALVSYLGIDTSGVTALITSLGVCVGLAVNGALSNLAGGFLILITRPFKIDDFIEAEGYSGTVIDIRITDTKIRTPDNKIVYLPNGKLSAAEIVNYSEEATRRVDITFGISYDNDFEKAKSILMDLSNQHAKVLKDPAPSVRMSEQGDSSINLTLKVWVLNGDYWDVKFDLLEAAKKAFDENHIEIPYNQLDVHIKNQ
ncbi:mscS Mechanosensitive ion channel [Coprobacillus sp. CAG:826]|nr:mechanosensitive ion channel [Coprobacillus sp.]CDD92317.1 mscS Mechanosensitive ion channel [Coprobacillus sp. CAG:826]